MTDRFIIEPWDWKQSLIILALLSILLGPILVHVLGVSR